MGRRAADHRRPVRSILWYWIWSILGFFFVAALLLFVVQHYQNEDRVVNPSEEKSANLKQENPRGSNFTDKTSIIASFPRQLSEQVTLAKAYIVIAKEHNDLHLAWQLGSMIRRCQLLLSKATMRGDPITLPEAEPIIKSLASLIHKAQSIHYDIATTIVTMKSHIQALEARANAATVQATVFGKLAAESLPKSLHCLILKLGADWLRNPNFKKLADAARNSPRTIDSNLFHFCIFSDNVVGSAVVVNSTVNNSEHPKQLVFHIVTSNMSYGAMQVWFLGNSFRGATIEVQSIDELSLPLFRASDSSIMSHLRFYIPEIYPRLVKVVFLDDDVVVQKDLTLLFALNLHGNVNGAVETCLESFHRFYKYLNFSNPIINSKFDPQACAWAFGMNVFDLVAWRKANVMVRFRYWQQQNADRNQTLWKVGTLPPALLAFYGLTEPLERRWHVMGLGYDANVDARLIENAAVIHFNGYMKPWMKLGFGRYKSLWERYVNTSHPYHRDCVSS